jgi:hypothetical protein
MYLEHVRESEDGHLEPLTNCGRYTCDHIRLNRADLVSWRRLKLQIAEDLLRFETVKTRLDRMLPLTTDATERSRILTEIATIESTALRLRRQFGM